MYKMLVVDDEYLVRLGITETVEWKEHDVEIVATAVNGKDGLEKIRELNPDIVISDVKMPVMNGVDMVKKLHEENFDGVMIMLSGYNDFEYAKNALEAGIFRYLLKPIDNEELVATVKTACERLEKKRKQDRILADVDISLPVIKQKLVDDIFHGVTDDSVYSKLSLYDLPIIDKGVVVYCKADVTADKVDTDEKVSKALEILQNGILDMLGDHKTIYSRTGKRVAFATDITEVDLLENKLRELLWTYEKQSKILVSIGISKAFGSVLEIGTAFGTAKFLAYNKLFASINSVNVPCGEDTKMYKKHIVDALQYVSKHYRECDLKIKVVADYLFVSESYLMHLFKNELGKTFNACLTEYRIMVAKSLLREEKHRMYEIAELVGYSDMKYFGQVFRKVEGCSPSEYVKKQHEKENT